MKKGFTLIELLVVVLIIGILSAVALPQYQKAVMKARMAEGRTWVANAKTAMELRRLAGPADAAIGSDWTAGCSQPEGDVHDSLEMDLPCMKDWGCSIYYDPGSHYGIRCEYDNGSHAVFLSEESRAPGLRCSEFKNKQYLYGDDAPLCRSFK